MSYGLFSYLINEHVLDLKFHRGLHVLQHAESLGLCMVEGIVCPSEAERNGDGNVDTGRPNSLS